MRLNKFLILGLTAFLVFSCNKDDDDGGGLIPPRDRSEVALEDDQELIEYLSTHFYNYEDFENPAEDFDYVIKIDTIAGDNENKIPIIDSENLITKTVNFEGVDEKLYVLKVRQGAGKKAVLTDSSLVAYRGELTNHSVFDSNLQSPVWFDLAGVNVLTASGPIVIGNVIKGFAEGLLEFNAATGFEVQPDNTIKWNDDFGIGAIFMPSGLGYFNSPPSGRIPTYSPLIFVFHLYNLNEADHDGDGVLSKDEDLDGDGDPFNDDTDGDGLSNHSDRDDDGDGKLTKDELGDKNEDGIPDYLDPDIFE